MKTQASSIVRSTLTAALLMCCLTTGTSYASGPPDSLKVFRRIDGAAFPIPEVDAIVTKSGKDLNVDMVPPAESRREQYKNVDLRAGDLILMVNGKRVKTIEELSAAHAAVAVGSEVKLGIQRGQQMMYVAFPKADPKDMPKRTIRIVTEGEKGTQIFPAVGVILKEKDSAVVIHSLIETEHTAVKGLDVKQGDIIRVINGKRVSTLASYTTIFDAIAVGDRVTWQIERKGARREVSFVRPKPMGGVIMKRKPE
jgi:PDZ domain-containing secreted protein